MRWRTRGFSPRSLGGVWHSFKVLFTVSSLCETFITAILDNISAGLGGAVRMCRRSRVFGAYPEGVASRRAPDPGPIRGDRDGLSNFSVRPLAVPPRDGGPGVCNSHRASREFQVPLRVVIGWFKWTPMPRSIRVGSWSGDSIFIQVGSGDSSFFQKFTVDQPNDFLFCHNWGIPLVMAPLVKYNHDKLFLYKSNYTFFW
jgi:hypothetical protein